jgi:serine/threonine-protein kinase
VSDDPFVGSQFGGRWIVERPLSSGGMGSVYVAKHSDTGRKVALKVIKSGAAGNSEFVGRFRRETEALAAVSHPNIVTFLDSGVENGNFYLVMELLAGRALRAEMGRPMPWQRAFRIASDVCRALSAVHKRGIVHRDLKPDNVFLQDAEGLTDHAKLIDFGIVRLEDRPAQTMTNTGALVGTPGYISPEQLQGKPATSASDVYAVGVILYELVTGVFPFDAPSTHAMLVRQLIDPIKAPREQNVALPAHVEHIVMSLMERDVTKRVHTAADALALLVDAGNGVNLAPSQATETALVAPIATPATSSAIAAISPSPSTTSATPTSASSARFIAAGLVVIPLAMGAFFIAHNAALWNGNGTVVTTPAATDTSPAPTNAIATPAPTTTPSSGTAATSSSAAASPTTNPDAGPASSTTTTAATQSAPTTTTATTTTATTAAAATTTAATTTAASESAATTSETGKGKLASHLDDRAMQRLIKEHAKQLHKCGGSGETRVVDVAIEPSGNVSEANVRGDDDALARCLSHEIKSWRTPPFAPPSAKTTLQIVTEQTSESPAVSSTIVALMMRSRAQELSECGGDKAERAAHVILKPDGTWSATSTPADFAEKCLELHAATWRTSPFEGDAVAYDIPVVLGK